MNDVYEAVVDLDIGTKDLQLLKNHRNPELSSWYTIDPEKALLTPEWTFEWDDLKRFE